MIARVERTLRAPPAGPSRATPVQDDLISLTEAGILAGLDSQQVRTRMMRGDFGKPQRGTTPGNTRVQWLVSRASVEAYLDRRAKQAAGTPAGS